MPRRTGSATLPSPYPANREVYDGTVKWRRDAVSKAKLGHSEKLKALKRLGEWAAS